MALMDKMKAQAAQLAQKAQEAGKAGQSKIEDAQAKRRADGMLRDLGAAVFAERSGTAPEGNDAEIERLVGELKTYESEHGAVATSAAAEADADAPKAADATPDVETPEGGFKL
jgi:hypothetical protein